MFEKSREQFSRVERYLERVLDNRDRDIVSYYDDVITFFMHCWHLKDWIENDDSFGEQIKRDVERFCEKTESIQMCRDLCHRSKHLEINDIKRDAEFSSRDTTVHCKTSVIEGSKQSSLGDGYIELTVTVNATVQGKHGGTLPTNINVIDLANELVELWRNFMVNHGALSV